MVRALAAITRADTAPAQQVTAAAPGFLVALLVAVAAQFLSDHYGAPAMLMALLLGIAFHFLSEEGRCAPGIDATARHVLRAGVALLGARISVGLLVDLGPRLVGLVVAGSMLTILFGYAASRLLRRGWRFGILTGGAVAICGASAAMAIAAVLPRNERSESNLLFTILGVTVLSTIAMIFYPMLSVALGLDPVASGVFLGAAIHDVAQVVGAGFSVSEQVGETATLVKLIRVTMLAPVVIALALLVPRPTPLQATSNTRPPLIPGFVLLFILLAAINSLGLIPVGLSNILSELSRWGLLTAIAAVGMRTSLRALREVGGQAIVLIVAETVFLASLILMGLHLSR